MRAGLSNRSWILATTSSLTTLPRQVYFRAYGIQGGTCVQAHQHSWWQFLFAREGLMQVQAGEMTILLPPDYGVWIPPGCLHTLWVSEEVELESLYIQAEAVTLDPGEARVVMVDDFVRAFIHHGCTSLPVQYDEAGAEGRKVQVLLDLLQSLPDAPLNLPFPANARLLDVCLAIQAAPHLPHTLEQSADLACMSTRSFSRHFLRATGLPFHQWRQRLRLLSALEMLRSGTTVTEVALTVGYSTPSAFIHAFKQLFGHSPKHFS